MISGIFTSVAFVMFLGVVYWAYTRHNRQRFEEAALLPLEIDSLPVATKNNAASGSTAAGPSSRASSPLPQAVESKKQCCGSCGGEPT